ncbi:MAG TPA: TIGR03086 family metal-binding protein [Acidimicrobiia bacterium]
MSAVDLGPATDRVAELVRAVGEELLDAPTPCPEYRLGDLLDHVGGLALAFAAAAEKQTGGSAAQGPSGDASRLGDDWRTRIPAALRTLAEAWRDPAAWSGTTEAGGVELPGEVAGLVALNEVVVHGWDIARASALPYEPDHASLEAVHGFLSGFVGSVPDSQADGPFGPAIELPDDAPLLDHVVALAGRDPAWPAGREVS